LKTRIQKPKCLTCFFCFGLLLLVYSCKPIGVLSSKEMTDLLVDIHLAEAMTDSKSGQIPASWRKGLPLSYFKDLSYESVLKKHGVSEADFYKSVAYYSKNLRLYSLIYADVETKLRNYEASVENWDYHRDLEASIQSMIETNKDWYQKLFGYLNLYNDTITRQPAVFKTDSNHTHIRWLTDRFMHIVLLKADTLHFIIHPDPVYPVVSDTLSAAMEIHEGMEADTTKIHVAEPVLEPSEVIREIHPEDRLIRRSDELAKRVHAKKTELIEPPEAGIKTSK
jgi:hypothetical protein